METKKLTSIVELIRESFRTYFKSENFAYLVKVILVMYLALGVSLIPAMILYGAGSFYLALMGGEQQVFWILLAVIIGILAFLVFIFAGLLMSTVFIVGVSQVTRGEIIGIKETFKQGWGKVWQYFGASLLAGLITALGFILLIIPGIIFSVWFAFAAFAAVTDNLGAVAALKKSKALVSGYFWPVLGRFVVFGILTSIIQMGVSFIPFMGPVIIMFLAPYFLLLPYLLYEDLKRARG